MEKIDTKAKKQNRLLINEVEQLILHAEEDSLDYSVLEHARKLIFTISEQNKENFEDMKVHEMGHLNEDNSER